MFEQSECHERAYPLHDIPNEMRRRVAGLRPRSRSPIPGRGHAPDGQSLSALRDVRVIRGVVALVALVLGVYCLVAAATALYAQPAPGHPDPEELAARERYRWPGWIPVTFLLIVVGYAVMVAARRRGRRRDPPSSQDPPPIAPSSSDPRRDTTSR